MGAPWGSDIMCIVGSVPLPSVLNVMNSETYLALSSWFLEALWTCRTLFLFLSSFFTAAVQAARKELWTFIAVAR